MTDAAPYAVAAPALLEAGLSAIPIMPSAKRPGRHNGRQWYGMSDWSRFCRQVPTPAEAQEFLQWPKANVGLALGEASGVVSIDFDDNGPAGLVEAIEAVLDRSPCRKVGKNGYNAFYLFSGEKPRKWKVDGECVCELLSSGNQTVLPPSIHPDGMAYRWEGIDLAEAKMIGALKPLPSDFIERVDEIVSWYAPDFQPAKSKNQSPTSTPQRHGKDYFREANDVALQNLALWVPRLLPNARLEPAGSYRCAATWRGGEDSREVSIHPEGIQDWANKPMTAVDLVKAVQGVDHIAAIKWLQGILRLKGPEKRHVDHIQFADVAPTVVVHDSQPEEAKAPEFKPSLSRDDVLGMIPKDTIMSRMHWHMVDDAHRAQPWLALGACLTSLGCVMGHRYRTESDVRTNIYTTAIAESGAGKEWPRTVIKTLFAKAGLSRLIGGSSFTSGQALFTALKKEPRTLFLVDEWGLFFQRISDPYKCPKHAQDIKDALLQLYSQANTTFHGTQKASSESVREDIAQPCLGLFGTTTPREFWPGVQSSSVANGLLGRFLVFVSDDPSPRRSKRGGVMDIDKKTIEALAAIERGPASRGNLEDALSQPEPVEVKMIGSAESVLDAFSDQIEDQRVANLGNVTVDLFARGVENVQKCALVRAVCQNPEHPSIETDDVLFGIGVVENTLSDLCGEISRNQADNLIEAQHKRVENVVFQTGPKGMSNRDMLRKTQWLRKREREEIVQTLVAAGVIEEISIKHPSGRVSHGFRHFDFMTLPEDAQSEPGEEK